MELFPRERTAGCLAGIVFFGILTLIVLSAIPYGTVDAKWESLFEAAVFALALLWIIEGFLTESFWIREHRLLVPLFALIAFAFIQCLTLWKSDGGVALAGGFVNRALSADPFETWRFFLKLLAITLTLGMLLRYTLTVAHLRMLIYVVIGVALASAIFGLVRPTLSPRLLGSAAARLAGEGSYGQFDNRNHFAFLMEMATGLAMGLAVPARTSLKRFLPYALLAVFFWVPLLLTHSRGAVISLLLEIPFFFVLYKLSQVRSDSQGRKLGTTRSRKLVTAAATICFLLAAVTAGVVLVGGDETVYRLKSTSSEFKDQTNGHPKLERPQIWKATLKLIKDHPVLGVGFAGYAVGITRYLSSAGEWSPEQAHNDYLELLASGGIVGGILGAWFLVRLVKTSRIRLSADAPGIRALRCGALAGLFGIAVHSVFDFGLHITVNALLCSALIVVAVKGVGELERMPARI